MLARSKCQPDVALWRRDCVRHATILETLQGFVDVGHGLSCFRRMTTCWCPSSAVGRRDRSRLKKQSAQLELPPGRRCDDLVTGLRPTGYLSPVATPTLAID